VKLAAKAAGLELASFGDLLSSVEAQATTHLVMFGAEVPGDEARTAATLSKLRKLVVFAVNESEITAAATELLPLSSHLEFEGTFVNYYGRVQRFKKVIAPKGDSLPGWAWVTLLSTSFGMAWSFQSAAEAFGLLASKGGAFQGLTLAGLPVTGVVLPGFMPAQFGKRAPRPEATAS
jgi:NADH-quinone oxidoreductase subunit G